MSSMKRKQLVNELRKAHFPFGFEANKDGTSEYKHKYPEHEISGDAHIGADRTNHFQIGGDDSKYYLSEFKHSYPGYQGSQLLPADQPHKSNDENNIVLGYDQGERTTNYHQDFNPKGNQPERVHAFNQRKTNVDFGDALTNFTSTYKQLHNAKEAQKASQPQTDSRNSNLMLGNDAGQYTTSNAATFTNKPINNQEPSKRNYGTNIDLGQGPPQYLSEHHHNYAGKEGDRVQVDERTIRDFRSAHFSLGFGEQPRNQTESQSNFGEKPMNGVVAKKIQGSNINLNVDGKDYFESSYRNQFKDVGGGQGKAGQKISSRDSNLIMGSDSNPNAYLTEAKAEYGRKDHGQKVHSVRPVGNLVLGENTQQYTTHYRDTHNQKQGSREIIKGGSREVNYLNGFHQGDYGQSSKEYGSKQGKANQLTKEVIAQMRGTNISNGLDHIFAGETTYGVEFGWKKGEI